MRLLPHPPRVLHTGMHHHAQLDLSLLLMWVALKHKFGNPLTLSFEILVGLPGLFKSILHDLASKLLKGCGSSLIPAVHVCLCACGGSVPLPASLAPRLWSATHYFCLRLLPSLPQRREGSGGTGFSRQHKGTSPVTHCFLPELPERLPQN